MVEPQTQFDRLLTDDYGTIGHTAAITRTRLFGTRDGGRTRRLTPGMPGAHLRHVAGRWPRRLVGLVLTR